MRKPFFVEGHQVTAKNMQEVADWCQGVVVTPEDGKDKFVRVPVVGARTPKQSEARIGCWVLRSLQGERDTFKVYADYSLIKQFDQVPGSDGEEPTTQTVPPQSTGSNVRPIRPTPAMFQTARVSVV